jgi:hypothetical protein
VDKIPLTDDAQLFATLKADGWELVWSRETGCHCMVHRANKWTTSLFYRVADAIKAAAALQSGAAATMEQRAATVEGLRKALR